MQFYSAAISLLPTILTTFRNKFVVFLEIKRARDASGIAWELGLHSNKHFKCRNSFSSFGVEPPSLSSAFNCKTRKFFQTSDKCQARFRFFPLFPPIIQKCFERLSDCGQKIRQNVWKQNKHQKFRETKIFKIEKCCLCHY